MPQRKITRKKEAQIKAELAQPLHWVYLSFSTDEEFLGGVIVEAHGFVTATREADRLGISPPDYVKNKAQVLDWDLAEKDMHKVPLDMRNRLLGERELDERIGTKGALDD